MQSTYNNKNVTTIKYLQKPPSGAYSVAGILLLLCFSFRISLRMLAAFICRLSFESRPVVPTGACISSSIVVVVTTRARLVAAIVALVIVITSSWGLLRTWLV